jgi:hypothetical protein
MVGQIGELHNQVRMNQQLSDGGLDNLVLMEHRLSDVVFTERRQVIVISRENALLLIETHVGGLKIIKAEWDMEPLNELVQSGQIEIVDENRDTIAASLLGCTGRRQIPARRMCAALCCQASAQRSLHSAFAHRQQK